MGNKAKLYNQLEVPVSSLLDRMVDGREYESLVKHKTFNLDIGAELKKALHEIISVRNKPAICYVANVVNTNIKTSTSIDANDDLPFAEMIAAVSSEAKKSVL